jgi:iron complex outermembrane receptor protein
MNKHIRKIIALAVISITSEQSLAVLEEVIVTARRKAENLQSVPAAVTNFGAEALQDAAIQDISGIANVTPSLVFSTANGTSVNPIISLRGQVQNDTSVITLDPSVGVYLDEVYLGRSPGSLLDMFDVARVEVLKGPQGTLYGRNTTGGALKVIPNKADPAGDWDGFLRFMLGNFGAVHKEAAINLPFTDTFAARASYSSRERDGHGNATLVASDDPDQIIGSFDVGAKETQAYRINFLLDVNDNISLELGHDNSDTETNGTPSYDQAGDRATTNAAGTLDGFERSSSDFYSYFTDVHTSGNAVTNGTYLKGIYDSQWGELKAIYAVRELDFPFLLDADGTSARGVIQDAHQSADQASFELQYSIAFFDDRLSMVLGYYDFIENGRDQFHTYASEVVAAALGVPTPPMNPPGSLALLNQTGDARVENTSESYFLQLSFELLDNVSFTTGARDVSETKSLDIYSRDTGLANDVLGPDANIVAITSGMQTDNCPYQPDADGVTNDGSDCRFTHSAGYQYKVWTLSADWNITDDTMVYLKKSRGSRSGGQNFRGRTAETLVPFDPEFVVDVETGLKADLFDNRVRLNLAAYHSKYSSIQFSNVVEVSTFVENLGDATIDGSELELTISATDNLTLIATGTLMNFEYDDPNKQGPYAPDKKASLSLNYKHPVHWGELGTAINYSYSGRVPLDNDTEAFKHNPYHSQDPVSLIGATAYIDIASLDLRIGFFVNNLTDEETFMNIIPSFLDADPNTGGVTTLGDPRRYGVDAIWRFSL